MIGSLLYLTTIRPIIVYSMGLCSIFQSHPQESHLKSIKRIFWYLKGTQKMILWYLIRDFFDLINYVDVDYVRYLVNKKSNYGMDHFLGPYFVSWAIKK